MTHFEGKYITEDDVKIAKNYLNDKELEYLRLLVSQFLDFAELQALEQKTMRMQDWVAKLDALLTLSGRQLLTGNGSISHEEACRKAIAEFREYRRREMIQYESDFDRAVRELTEGGEHPAETAEVRRRGRAARSDDEDLQDRDDARAGTALLRAHEERRRTLRDQQAASPYAQGTGTPADRAGAHAHVVRQLLHHRPEDQGLAYKRYKLLITKIAEKLTRTSSV